MKKNIISVNSTLRKRKFKHNKKNKIMNAHSSMLRNESTGKLKLIMIIIMILIILVILTVLFFGIREILKISSFYEHENSQQPLEHSEVFSPADSQNSEKLMTVVSPNKPIDSDYELNISEYKNIKIDVLALNGLERLMQDAEKDGLSLNIDEGYVSVDEQNSLYNNEVQRLISQKNYSRVHAETEAEKNVPKGGCADSQTGLSVKFSVDGNKTFDKSDEYQWLIKNAINYGFVLRYPENKEDKTNITYNPALFRYVGVENATKMRTLNMCLDEYSSYLNSRN